MTFIYNFQVTPPTFGVTIVTPGGCMLVEEVGAMATEEEYAATINAAAGKVLGLKNELETIRTNLLNQL